MTTKTLNTRIQNKYDSAANWNQIETSFRPLEGEMIIYAADADNSAPRIKIGDGQNYLVDLQFTEGSSTVTKITTVPSQSGSLTYNGAIQEPTWSNYDSSKMYISGVTRATNAGSHTAKFTPLTGYCWSDGSTAAKSVTWKINKATGSLTLSETSVGLPISTASKTVTIVTDSDGTITATSNATSVVTVEVFGKSVILTKVGQGSATVTVNLAAGTNYTAASATIAVMTDTTLERMSWADIRSISDEGTGANYWSVGDCKSVVLNGTIGTLSVNDTYWVYILGFNHNSTYEGTGIHFGGFKTAQTGGKDVCLCDSKYNSDSGSDGIKYFSRDHWGGGNYGGWKGCDLRYDILGSTDAAPSGYGSAVSSGRTGYDASTTTATNPVAHTLMAALPADLRAVMQPMTKYTNNIGGFSDDASYVTVSKDYLPLLSEFEVQGVKYHANSAEQHYQEQYQYYASGNSKIKYKHNETTTSVDWMLRSCFANSDTHFCDVLASVGDSGGSPVGYSFGLAPVFKV